MTDSISFICLGCPPFALAAWWTVKTRQSGQNDTIGKGKRTRSISAVRYRKADMDLFSAPTLILILVLTFAPSISSTEEHDNLDVSTTILSELINDLFSSKRLYIEDYSELEISGDVFIIDKNKYYSLLPSRDVKLLSDEQELKFHVSGRYISELMDSRTGLSKLKGSKDFSEDDKKNIEKIESTIDSILDNLTTLRNDTDIQTEDILCTYDLDFIFDGLHDFTYLVNKIDDNKQVGKDETEEKKIQKDRSKRNTDNEDTDTENNISNHKSYSEYVQSLMAQNSDLLVNMIMIRKNDITSDSETVTDWSDLFNNFMKMSPENELEDDLYTESLCKIIFSLPSLTDIVTIYENGNIVDQDTGEVIKLLDDEDSLKIEKQFVLDLNSLYLDDIEIDYLLFVRRKFIRNPEHLLDFYTGRTQNEIYEKLSADERTRFEVEQVQNFQSLLRYKKMCKTTWGGSLNEYSCPRRIVYDDFLAECLLGRDITIYSGIDEKKFIQRSTDTKTLIRAKSDPNLFNSLFGHLNVNNDILENIAVSPTTRSFLPPLETGSGDSRAEDTDIPKNIPGDDITLIQPEIQPDNNGLWWDNTANDLTQYRTVGALDRQTRNDDECVEKFKDPDQRLDNGCLRKIFEALATTNANNDRSHSLAIITNKVTSTHHLLLATLTDLKSLETVGTMETLQKFCKNLPNIQYVENREDRPILYTNQIQAAIMKPVRFCSDMFCHILIYDKPYLLTADKQHCSHGKLVGKNIFICLGELTDNHHPCYASIDGFANCNFQQFATTTDALAIQMVNSGSGFIKTDINLLRINQFDTRRTIDMVTLETQKELSVQLFDNSQFFLSKEMVRKFFDKPDTAMEVFKSILYSTRNYSNYMWSILAVIGLMFVTCSLFITTIIIRSCRSCVSHYRSVPTAEPAPKRTRNATAMKLNNKTTLPKSGTATSQV